MKATIDNERKTEEGRTSIAMRVEDNNGVEHGMELGENGELHVYRSEYPDKSEDRTPEQSNHINQAYRFAKYYAHCELGYDTLGIHENPFPIAAAALVVAGAERDTF
ncbi:MAG: hypothetical protein SXQ77_09625, partial [Halobacteria archaeon]|nr:hypothetical protein [Halobacteria archaeon]